MVIVQELIRSLILLTNIVFTVLSWLLVLRIVLSWFGVNPSTTYHELLGALYQVTDILLRPFRKLPLRIGLLDFSPIVAFLALQLINRLIVVALLALGGVRV